MPVLNKVGFTLGMLQINSVFLNERFIYNLINCNLNIRGIGICLMPDKLTKSVTTSYTSDF